MNRRRKTPELNMSSLVVLFLAALIVAGGGVSFVIVKNKQVTLRKEIERSEHRIHDHRVAITEHQADIEETLGVFRLRERLSTSGSDLQPIPAGLPELYRTPGNSPPSEHVAVR